MKTNVKGLISRLNTTTLRHKQKSKVGETIEQRTQELQDNAKQCNTYLREIMWKEKRRNGAEEIPEDIMAKNLLNLRRDTKLIHKAQRTPCRVQTKKQTSKQNKTTSKHVSMLCLNCLKKKKIFFEGSQRKKDALPTEV